MNIEALQQMIRVLKSVKPEYFDLTNWWCGSYACAIGHACNDQWFIDRGFSQLSYGDRIPAFFEEDDLGESNLQTNWLAVEKFFGLDVYVTQRLFSVKAYPNGSLTNPQEVIERIQELVNSQ